mmetsp:Transcript_4991/g.8846  ORF Transcript_4991/g.8846 Transcript_4991/m.8846 type:complete len:451 (+) Transcript_4991:133-1485(+)|eukprot:CAMPEP_0178786612 /NCGR_PEP_ID=MMETSP0745-20121128/5408_1 /TAXON_ID=913974 /ORGANISM="Nitzschia punctata, Strain CCMP561" /LENGTH=450 /DNA_ID=CAMNT_0020444395 /DNA_START=19 /DNA_END=1371 /DNA_ORIENTATION=+
MVRSYYRPWPVLLGLLAMPIEAAAWIQPNRRQKQTSLPMEKSKSNNLDRRGALGGIVSVATGILTLGTVEASSPRTAMAEPPLNLPILHPETSNSSSQTEASSSTTKSFDTYFLTPDEKNVRSKLEKIDSQTFLKQIAASESGGAVWLGEHHNSAADHDFQAAFIEQVYKRRRKAPMAIGLEQVQQEFQPVLDAYIDGKISIDRMRFMVQWDKRWMWSFDNYRKIFETAQQFKIPLLALNVDSEDLSLVEKAGYPGLPKERLRKYIKDPVGFSQFALEPEFKSYVDYVIQPSYDLHRRMGLLRYTMAGEEMEEEMTFRRFLSGRILWDEGMASGAFSWCSNNPDGLLIGLVGADHVKFKNGIPGRFQRMAAKDNKFDCISVVINPTLIDSRPSGSVASIPTSDSAAYPDRITLQLRYVKSDGLDLNADAGGPRVPAGEGVLQFSDYVVVT